MKCDQFFVCWMFECLLYVACQLHLDWAFCVQLWLCQTFGQKYRNFDANVLLVDKCLMFTFFSVFFFKACEPGYYKSTDSSQPCEVCPENTKRSGHGALLCPCMEGFFRAPTDPNSAPCSCKCECIFFAHLQSFFFHSLPLNLVSKHNMFLLF